jgi:hypothetical protein
LLSLDRAAHDVGRGEAMRDLSKLEFHRFREIVFQLIYPAILGSMLYELLYNRGPSSYWPIGKNADTWAQVAIVATFLADWWYIKTPGVLAGLKSDGMLGAAHVCNLIGSICFVLASAAVARCEADVATSLWWVWLVAALYVVMQFFRWPTRPAERTDLLREWWLQVDGLPPAPAVRSAGEMLTHAAVAALVLLLAVGLVRAHPDAARGIRAVTLWLVFSIYLNLITLRLDRCIARLRH